MPLPPQVDKAIRDFDKLLHEPGTIQGYLGQIEAKTNVKRLHIVAGLFVLHALYLIFGRSAELLCNVTGFLYPAYISIKAIETMDKSDDTQWLTYWVVFALFNTIEFFSDAITRYFPLYWFVKWVFLLYLHLPMTRGAEVLYNRFVRPFVHKHGNTVDQVLRDERQKFEERVKAN